MFKIGDRVRYLGKNINIIRCIGTVMATPQDNEYEDYKLRIDEILVDFGFEDTNEYVVRLKSLELLRGE